MPHSDRFHRWPAESLSELVPQLFTRSSRWQNMTPRTRAHQLWLLLRAGLHDFVEKVRPGCLPCSLFLGLALPLGVPSMISADLPGSPRQVYHLSPVPPR